VDEHELLLRHAERWASERNRVLDVELLGTRCYGCVLFTMAWPPTGGRRAASRTSC